MSHVNFFRAKKAECEQLARLAHDEEHRSAFADLAARWEDLAASTEQSRDGANLGGP